MSANALASFPCPKSFCSEQGFLEKYFPPLINSNNLLAGKPERENDRARETFSSRPFLISLRLKRRLKRQRQGFIQMINRLGRAAARWASMATVILAAATPALSQAPTDAQRAAIRSECRSDYEAHCASVPPGGAASLQCLQKNISGLSPGCQTAVRAVEAPAAPKAESA